MSKIRDALCYISIELNDDLACPAPLAQISLALRELADQIEEFEEDQILNETIIMRNSSQRSRRKRIGQADLYVREQGDD